MLAAASRATSARSSPGPAVPTCRWCSSLLPAPHPVFLLSRLALHTRNLIADPRVSLLVDATDSVGDPVAGGRVTFFGVVHPTER